jgi:hypothetical protein
MKGDRAFLTAVAIGVVLLAGWWLFGGGGGRERVDLIATFDSALKQPDASHFSLADVALNNETMRAISVVPAVGTRLTWKVQVPDDGWLWVSVGVKPEAWEQEGNGVLFFVGVADGRAYDTLFTLHVDPSRNPADRRWIPVKVDLSAYAGEQVDLIFNTRGGPPGLEGDVRNDYALWGSPEVVAR